MKVFTLIFLTFALIITMVACKDVDIDPAPTAAETTTQAPTTAGSVTTTDTTTASTSTSTSTSTTDATTATTIVTTVSIADILKNPSLEPDRQDLPTYAELCEIQLGMTPDEVTALVGNPQRTIVLRKPLDSYASPIHISFYIFDSCDGDSVGVAFVGEGSTQAFIYGVKFIEIFPREE